MAESDPKNPNAVILKPGDRIKVERVADRPRPNQKPQSWFEIRDARNNQSFAKVSIDTPFVIEADAKPKKDGAPLPIIHSIPPSEQQFPSFEFHTPAWMTGSFKVDGKSTVPPQVMLGKEDGIEKHQTDEKGNLSLTVRISGHSYTYIIENGAPGITFTGKGNAVTIASEKEVKEHQQQLGAPPKPKEPSREKPMEPAPAEGSVTVSQKTLKGMKSTITQMHKQVKVPSSKHLAEIFKPVEDAFGDVYKETMKKLATNRNRPADFTTVNKALDDATDKLDALIEKGDGAAFSLKARLNKFKTDINGGSDKQQQGKKTGMSMPKPAGIPPEVLDKAVSATTLPKSGSPLIIDVNRKTTEPPAIFNPGGSRSIT